MGSRSSRRVGRLSPRASKAARSRLRSTRPPPKPACPQTRDFGSPPSQSRLDHRETRGGDCGHEQVNQPQPKLKQCIERMEGIIVSHVPQEIKRCPARQFSLLLTYLSPRLPPQPPPFHRPRFLCPSPPEAAGNWRRQCGMDSLADTERITLVMSKLRDPATGLARGGAVTRGKFNHSTLTSTLRPSTPKGLQSTARAIARKQPRIVLRQSQTLPHAGGR